MKKKYKPLKKTGKTLYKVKHRSLVSKSFDYKNYLKVKPTITKCEEETNYQKFLNSGEWKEFRKKVIGDKCSICPKRKHLQVHHLSYERGLFDEESVITLCKDCHNYIHKKHKDNIGLTLREITEHLLSGKYL